MTVRCKTDVHAAIIDYDRFKELYFRIRNSDSAAASNRRSLCKAVASFAGAPCRPERNINQNTIWEEEHGQHREAVLITGAIATGIAFVAPAQFHSARARRARSYPGSRFQLADRRCASSCARAGADWTSSPRDRRGMSRAIGQQVVIETGRAPAAPSHRDGDQERAGRLFGLVTNETS